MLHRLFVEAFDDLLVAWRAHDDLRKAQAPLSALGESHDRLEQARRTVDRYRRAFAPGPRDVEAAALVVHCSRVDEPVLLYRRDAKHFSSVPSWQCVCGDAIEIGTDHPIRPRPW